MKKRSLLAVSVTTQEALDACLADQLRVISIEDPLYSTLRGRFQSMEALSEYNMEEYVDMHFMILTKARGQNIFDPEKFEYFYFPLRNR